MFNEHLDKIKRLAIIAMFSDDDLMDQLVLKGGNALDVVYNVTPRASLDLDFSIPTEFKPSELSYIQSRIKSILEEVFNENGYNVFDLRFK